MERTISVWSDQNVRDQLWRRSTLNGLVISVGRTEMTLSIWQNGSTALLYPAYKNNNQTRGGLGRVCATGMYFPIRQVEFPKFRTGIFVEWKAPKVIICRLSTTFGRSLQQLAMVSEWIRELQNLTTLKGAVSRLSCSFFNRELEQQRFWATDFNGKWTFCITGEWFGWNSRVNRLYKRKETEQYKFVSAKVDKTEERLTSGWRASLKNVFAQGDYTREDSQRRFLAQQSVATLLRHCSECFFRTFFSRLQKLRI